MNQCFPRERRNHSIRSICIGLRRVYLLLKYRVQSIIYECAFYSERPDSIAAPSLALEELNRQTESPL